jgi:hypothetical protein
VAFAVMTAWCFPHFTAANRTSRAAISVTLLPQFNGIDEIDARNTKIQ